jgi:hypothetical protein
MKARKKLFEVTVRGNDCGQFLQVWAATPAGAVSHAMAQVKSKRLRNTVRLVQVAEIIQVV